MHLRSTLHRYCARIHYDSTTSAANLFPGALQLQCLAGIDEQQLLTIGHHMFQIVEQHQQCLEALEAHSPAQAKFLAESALQLAGSMPGPAKALGPHHIWRMRVLEALNRSCIDLGKDWHQTFLVGKQLVPIYDMVYPKVR